MICHYIRPASVLNAFFRYNERVYLCIYDYHQKINLTKCSYSDINYFLMLYERNYLKPLVLTISDAKIPGQIEYFINSCSSSTNSNRHNVRYLSLLECNQTNLCGIYFCLQKFKFLKYLCITESVSAVDNVSTEYLVTSGFYDFLFNKPPAAVKEIRFITNNGMILNRQLRSNEYLKRLTISVHDIHDLYVLLDGLVPQLAYLHVIICHSPAYKQLSLPHPWPDQLMSHLLEFHLTTNEDVILTLDQLCSIFMVLPQLHQLTLHIKQWMNDEQQLEILIDQYLPNLHHFYCSIQPINDLDVKVNESRFFFEKSIATLNERWPMKYMTNLDNLQKHLYTTPWPFEHLDISMLAKDDTLSICSNVQHLTVGKSCSDLSSRFPNIHTLIISPDCHLPPNSFIGFRRLRHLTMSNINTVPSSVMQRIHTLTLFETDGLSNHSIIYSNLSHLILKSPYHGSTAELSTIIQHFPKLHSLEIQFASNMDYYENLNVLLNRKSLPELTWLKTNALQEHLFCTNIYLLISSKTLLKWRRTSYYVQCYQTYLIISL